MSDEWYEGIGECKELRCEEPRRKTLSGRCPAEQVVYARFIASGTEFDRDDPSKGNALCISNNVFNVDARFLSPASFDSIPLRFGSFSWPSLRNLFVYTSATLEFLRTHHAKCAD